jgi:hypothetical protein
MQEVAQFRGTESAVAVVSETEPGDSLSKPAWLPLPVLYAVCSVIVFVYVCHTSGHYA